MPKKRIIFTLLFDSNNKFFHLSRNFNLQKVGDIEWLNKNYNFDLVSRYIDELIVLDVTREESNLDEFCKMLKNLSCHLKFHLKFYLQFLWLSLNDY